MSAEVFYNQNIHKALTKDHKDLNFSYQVLIWPVLLKCKVIRL